MLEYKLVLSWPAGVVMFTLPCYKRCENRMTRGNKSLGTDQALKDLQEPAELVCNY